MKKLLRIFIWVVVSCGILFGSYFVYERWWDKETVKSIAGKVKGAAVKLVDGASDVAKETVGKVAGRAVEAVGDFVKSGTASVLSSVGEKLTSLGSTIVGEELSTSSNGSSTVSAPSGSGFALPPPLATINTKVNTPLVFSINRESSYKIQWGDGNREDGAVPEDSSRLVSHLWEKKGDYTIQFELKEKELTHTYSFPVRVYD